MPLATDCRAYPYPEDADPIDVAADIQRLAVAVDLDVCSVMDAVERAPVGTVRMTIRQVADPGWAQLGASLLNADTVYPEFWAIAPVAWRSGTTLIIPSMADRVPTGVGSSAVGATAGSNSRALTAANLPPHQHTIDHDHPQILTGTENQAHVHSVNINSGGVIDDTLASISLRPVDTSFGFVVQKPGGGSGFQLISSTNTIGTLPTTEFFEAGLAPQHVHNVAGSTAGASAAHNHYADIPLFQGLSGTGGFANTPVDMRQASLALYFEIRVVP